MKFIRNLGKYPFMMLLIISAVILTLAAYLGKNSVYADYSVDVLKHPRLSVVFEGIKDGTYPWGKAKENETVDVAAGEGDSKGDSTANTPDKDSTEDAVEGTNSNPSGSDSGETSGSTPVEGSKDSGKSENEKGADSTGKEETDGGTKDTGNGTNGSTSIDTEGSTQNSGTKDPGDGPEGSGENGTGKGSQNPGNDGSGKDGQNGTKENDNHSSGSGSKDTGKTKGDKDPDKTANPDSESSYEFVAVKKSYFDNALFIGDSRTVGLSDYSGWKNPTFFADVGLTIYDVFDKKVAEVDGKKMTIEEALKKKSFQKIYIMLGINEMGTGTAKSFTKAYKEVVERIHELQPEAIIFVEAIMNVTKEKSDTDPIFNNKNIKDRNNHLKGLADGKKIFYIDVNEAITDNTGGIPAKYTFDNIHLKAAYYKIWTDFLLKHGVSAK